jgi:hypothetical protein
VICLPCTKHLSSSGRELPRRRVKAFSPSLHYRFLQPRYESEPKLPNLPSFSRQSGGAFSYVPKHSGCILWRNSHRGEAIGVLAADVVSIAYYYSSEIWKWLRTESIKRCQEKVKTLLRRLNKGEVNERNGGDLRGMLFRMVDHFRK